MENHNNGVKIRIVFNAQPEKDPCIYSYKEYIQKILGDTEEKDPSLTLYVRESAEYRKLAEENARLKAENAALKTAEERNRHAACRMEARIKGLEVEIQLLKDNSAQSERRYRAAARDRDALLVKYLHISAELDALKVVGKK